MPVILIGNIQVYILAQVTKIARMSCLREVPDTNFGPNIG
jgi:hypothetical protein